MALAFHSQLESAYENGLSTKNRFVAGEQMPLQTEAFPGELAALRAQLTQPHSVVSSAHGRKKTEQGFAPYPFSQALQENQLADHLIEVMPTGLVMLDGDGIVVKINHVARRLLNEPILGQPWFSVIRRSFKPREDDWHEVSLNDGRRVKLEITSLGEQPGQLIMITDLTETRLLQDKLSQMQRLSSLGRMVSTLAHQIRTPLSAAMLYSANLANNKLTETARHHFQEKLSSRLQDLEQQVNDMLLFSKSGTEQVVNPVAVNSFLADVVQAMEPLLNKAQAEVKLQFCRDKCHILANKNALTGAIHNLIHNTLQVVDKQAVINMQVYSHADDVYISVKDNGPGIASHLKEKIFQPFYTSRCKGTGLGLAVVKSVVNAHQGEVSLISQENEGAHFIIKLPRLAYHSSSAQSNAGEAQ